MTKAPDNFDHPILSPKIAGKPVRFFRAPHDTLPYVALDDIFNVISLEQDQRARLTETVLTGERAKDLTPQQAAWAKPLAVTTPNGSEIVLHQVAICGLLRTLIDASVVPQTLAAEYRSACESALDAMYDGSAPAPVIEQLRTVALAMYDFDEARPS